MGKIKNAVGNNCPTAFFVDKGKNIYYNFKLRINPNLEGNICERATTPSREVSLLVF